MFLNVKNQVSASSHLKILHWDLCYCRRGVERGWRDRHTGAGRAALTHGELTEAGGSSRFLLAVCWHKGLSVCPALLCLSPDHKTMACSAPAFSLSLLFFSVQPQSQASQDVEKALTVFEHTGKVPVAILEAR